MRPRIDTPKPEFVQVLPAEGYVRLQTILKVFPISASSWWKGVKARKYPPPVKLSPNTTAWKVRDIRLLLESVDKGIAA